MSSQPPKLLAQVRMALRSLHYSPQAEETCVSWITRFILFHQKRHPAVLAAPEVMSFLSSLSGAAERDAARSAILFLYQQVLNRPLDLPADAPGGAAPTGARPPTDPLAALLDQAREALRVKHYAYSTEQSYLDWIKRFVRYHHQRHPRELGGAEVAAFLTYLAVDQHVASSTQNQALSALLFLYREVLRKELDYPMDTVRAKESQHLPAVLTKDETRRVIAQLSGVYQLQAKLLYGAGLRLLECLRLRVKDLDFERRAIIVRDTKGDEDRVTMLPDSVVEPLKTSYRLSRPQM